MLSNWASVYRGIRLILWLPIILFIYCLVLYSISGDLAFLDVASWTWVSSLVCLLASAHLIYGNTSDWFWEMALAWYEDSFTRTATGYWFKDRLSHVVITSSYGPVYTGIVMLDGKTIVSDLNPLDVTLFMELIGDS